MMDEEIVFLPTCWTTTVSSNIIGETDSDTQSNQSHLLESPIGYCGTSLKPFQNWYGSFHSYASLAFCLLGVFANILNLIVFTRKSMRNPTNFILAGLAFADLLKTLEYIPYAIYLTFPNSRTYAWAVYVLFHSNFSQVCHTASILLTVTVACWRYVMIANYGRGKTLCSMERARWAVVITCVSSPILCIPVYLSFSVKRLPTESSQYVVNLSELADHNPELMQANFWFYSVAIKIIPCILLTVVSFCLIYSIIQAKKRKRSLLSMPFIQTVSGESFKAFTARGSYSESKRMGSDLVTRMLLAVNLLYLVTELPQGILGLVSAMLGNEFFKTCYIPLADLMDLMALLNSALNFILYYLMRSRFRETFGRLFHSFGNKVVPS